MILLSILSLCSDLKTLLFLDTAMTDEKENSQRQKRKHEEDVENDEQEEAPVECTGKKQVIYRNKAHKY